jgi:hypothetical protein
MAAAKVECNACPILCQIAEGRTGACDRYANQGGVLVRVDPVVLLRNAEADAPALVQFSGRGAAEAASGAPAESPAWTGDLLRADEVFVTGVGSSTTYPDYKPAPFIVGSQVQGVDMVTVVTEGIFSYCSLKVKIDTDRYLGPEQANVRCKGEVVGHVTTAEYGSQMLSLGGVHHLTRQQEGRPRHRRDDGALGNRQAVELSIDGGAQLVIQAGRAPIVNGVAGAAHARGLRLGHGGHLRRQLFGHADEVVVVDDHITGVLTEHQAGRCLDMRPSGIPCAGASPRPGATSRSPTPAPAGAAPPLPTR